MTPLTVANDIKKKEYLQQYTEINLSNFLKKIWILSSDPKKTGAHAGQMD